MSDLFYLAAEQGLAPEAIKAWSEVFLQIAKDWWVFLLPILAIFFPRVRQAIGATMQKAGAALQPKPKDK